MYIESWLKGQRESRTAELVVDNTLTKLKERSRVLDKYVPMSTKDGRDWLAYVTEQIDPIASLVSTGQEYPSTQKGKFRQIESRLFKAALKHEWNEDLQWRLKEVNEFAKARGITIQNISVGEGKIQVGQDNSLAELIFGTLTALVRGHVNLLDYLAWQVIQTGAMQYSDSRTGLNINLDWKPALTARYNHFPSQLTGARRWTEFETANGIQDLVEMHYAYKYDNGFAADEIAMSEQLIQCLLRQKSTREAVVSSLLVGGTSMTGTVSIEQLNDVLGRRFLPPIVSVDDHFQLDGDNTGSNIPTRFLDPTRVAFLKKGMAQRVLGGTLENGGKAGIYQRTYEKSKEPPLDISSTVSMMIVTAPSIAKQGFSRKMTDNSALEQAQNLADFEF
ncbi:hypothetical protein [Chroococcidiopsis sp.]|uniref:hypothetical protein n=1 Tax=Chroococcidiopsis sp. TaxID=3088168 RepID=UPI003F2F094B